MHVYNNTLLPTIVVVIGSLTMLGIHVPLQPLGIYYLSECLSLILKHVKISPLQLQIKNRVGIGQQCRLGSKLFAYAGVRQLTANNQHQVRNILLRLYTYDLPLSFLCFIFMYIIYVDSYLHAFTLVDTVIDIVN